MLTMITLVTGIVNVLGTIVAFVTRVTNVPLLITDTDTLVMFGYKAYQFCLFGMVTCTHQKCFALRTFSVMLSTISKYCFLLQIFSELRSGCM
jgi:hypothetical protein